MKILYHHRVASKDGQYVHIEEIISSLRKLGHEVIVCEPASIQATKFGKGSGAVQKIRSLLPGGLHELAEFLYSVHDYLKLRRLIKRHNPDGIYERYNLFFVSGVWASKQFNLPLIMEVNAPLFEERLKNDGISLKRLARWSEDYSWKNANYVLPVTEVLAKIIKDRGVDHHNLKVIHNGINATFETNLPSMDVVNKEYGLSGKLVLGFSGFVREWHGLDRVLSIIAANADKNWHLFLVGDGPDRSRLQSMARDLGILERLTITGVIQRNEMPGLIQRFDVALQPDVVPYASPLKMFEYMALGKAILAPDTDNIREILENGKNALLFQQADGAFAKQLTCLCEEPDLRRELGTAARSTIGVKQFYWDSNAKKIVNYFEQGKDFDRLKPEVII